jgi:hypothetical protein
MFLSHYVFSKGFFSTLSDHLRPVDVETDFAPAFWIVLSFIWVFCSTAISVILPLVEARGFFVDFYKKVRGDFTKR